jgi:F-type H+-transporting ATPase subunit gamma
LSEHQDAAKINQQVGIFMATSREIRQQIDSIKSTQKITRAMQLVAASKIRKAQNRILASRPYAEKIRGVIGHVANSHSEFHHHYLQKRPQIKRVAYVMVSSDRGLCGGLNTNLFKKLIITERKAWRKKNIDIDLCLIGGKATTFFKHTDFNIVAQVGHVGASSVNDIVGAMRATLMLYDTNKIDRVFIMYNEFVNKMVQNPKVQQLLPLEVGEDESKGHYWDYIYEPDAPSLLDTLIKRFLEAQVYQAILENISCEHAARMIAMKSATDNAGSLINELKSIYNKTRQATITREINEIISGAAAV